MKLERLAGNKIKYYITFEELSNKGFLEEEFESYIWYDLFDEMVEIAKEKYKCDIPDTISIEIFSLNSKEIVLILTMEEMTQLEEDTVQLKNLENEVIYCFESIEEIIRLSYCLMNLQIKTASKLYLFEDLYYLSLPNKRNITALCEEYGLTSSISQYILEDYGNIIINKNALEQLTTYFKSF